MARRKEETRLDLVERARARDRDAFELLLEQHLGDVHRIALAIVGPADAMDVTQETLVVAWQQLPRLRKPDAFGGWLRRICVNNARQWLRRARRRGAGASIDGGDTLRPTLEGLPRGIMVGAKAVGTVSDLTSGAPAQYDQIQTSSKIMTRHGGPPVSYRSPRSTVSTSSPLVISSWAG